MFCQLLLIVRLVDKEYLRGALTLLFDSPSTEAVRELSSLLQQPDRTASSKEIQLRILMLVSSWVLAP